MKTVNETEINRIVLRYKRLKVEKPDLQIEFCKSQRNLKNAIKVAAQSIDKNNHIHNHQKRVGRKDLNEFARVLCTRNRQIAKVKDFDELYRIVESLKIEDIGKLTIYDTAHRIGFFLNIFPDKIYLHSGTKKGAKNVIGKLPRQEYIFQNELPPSFQRPDIEPWELEDILCSFFKGKPKSRI